jgi:ElaB/YqjD/DUF883 family membrane-anchored ribosome-binding protein
MRSSNLSKMLPMRECLNACRRLWRREIAMTTTEKAQDDWTGFVKNVQKKYSQITGEDLESVKGNVQQMAEVIQRKTGKAKEEIESFLHSIGSQASHATEQLREATANMVGQASEGLREGYKHAAEMSHQGYEKARETVRENPVEALAITYGVGVVTGLLLGCCMYSRK